MCGQTDELGHGAEARSVVNSNVPCALMACGNNSPIYLRPGAAAGLSQQGSGYGESVVVDVDAPELSESLKWVAVVWLPAVGGVAVGSVGVVCALLILLPVLMLFTRTVIRQVRYEILDVLFTECTVFVFGRGRISSSLVDWFVASGVARDMVGRGRFPKIVCFNNVAHVASRLQSVDKVHNIFFI